MELRKFYWRANCRFSNLIARRGGGESVIAHYYAEGYEHKFRLCPATRGDGDFNRYWSAARPGTERGGGVFLPCRRVMSYNRAFVRTRAAESPGKRGEIDKRRVNVIPRVSPKVRGRYRARGKNNNAVTIAGVDGRRQRRARSIVRALLESGD